jgi:uncharacterized protein
MWSLIGLRAASAFVTGLTGSLHCALMCGPLACASLGSNPLSPSQRAKQALSWNMGRIASYCVVGLLLGGLGSTLKKSVVFQVAPVLPWLMAFALVATAFDFGKRFKPIPGVRFIASSIARFSATLSPLQRSFFMGHDAILALRITLRNLFSRLATGSVWGGAVVMGAFSFGAVPAFASLQRGVHLLPKNPLFQMGF